MEGQLVGSEIHGFRTLQGMYKFLSLFFFFFFYVKWIILVNFGNGGL